MKHTLPAVLLALLLCGLSCPHAHAQSDPDQRLGPAESKRAFSNLPLNDPAYANLDTLQSLGLPIASPYGTIGSRIGLDGYGFGVATARLLSYLQPVDPAARLKTDLLPPPADVEAFEAKLKQNPAAIECLLALINEFQPELLKLHQDVSAAKQRLFEISPFAYVPYNDPAYKALDVLQDANLASAVYPGTNRVRIRFRSKTGTYTRNLQLSTYEFAVTIAQVYPLPLPNAKFPQTPAEYAAQRTHADAILAANPFALQALQSLTEEFRPMLDKLGQDVPMLNTRLAALAVAPKQLPLLAAKPFPDVPPNHWASQSMEALRTAGVVAGYPAGTFRTDGAP